MTDDTLPRFYQALVEALRERSPADLERPFTVAEIYQDLVPYRTHRDDLGFEMNADYEHALLRLLAGEGGFLRLESEHALRDIRAELEEKDPNTTVYRDYAAVDVRIDPFVLRSGNGDSSEAFESEDGADAPEAGEERLEVSTESAFFAGEEPAASDADMSDSEQASDMESAEAEDTQPTATLAVAAASTATPTASTGATIVTGEDDHCAWCRSELPSGRTVLYCPYCGQDQSLLPCRSCGEALEQDWQFCITCGAQAAS